MLFPFKNTCQLRLEKCYKIELDTIPCSLILIDSNEYENLNWLMYASRDQFHSVACNGIYF